MLVRAILGWRSLFVPLFVFWGKREKEGRFNFERNAVNFCNGNFRNGNELSHFVAIARATTVSTLLFYLPLYILRLAVCLVVRALRLSAACIPSSPLQSALLAEPANPSLFVFRSKQQNARSLVSFVCYRRCNPRRRRRLTRAWLHQCHPLPKG